MTGSKNPGAALIECPICGSDVEPDEDYCTECGNDFNNDTKHSY